MSHTHPLLGQPPLPTDSRDAIHFPVAPLIAAETMLPGTHVGVAGGKAYPERYGLTMCGIIDPFLTEPVLKDQPVWVMIYQNTITGLRHEWDHPAWTTPVAAPVPAAKSKVKRAPRPKVIPDDSQSPGMDICCPRTEKARPMLDMAAEGRIQQAADDAGLSRDELIEAANEFLDHGTYLCEGGRWESHRLPSTFWDDFATITGREVPGYKRWSFFSCSF